MTTVEIDQMLLGLSILFVLTGAGCWSAAFLADESTYAGALRLNRLALATTMLLFAAGGTAATTGTDFGLAAGGFWFILALTSTPTSVKKSRLAEVRREEENHRLELAQRRREQLERDAAAADELADSLDLPRMPRVRDEA